MAITNIVQPNRWNRRRSKIIFSFLSDQLAQPNFRYVIRLVQGNGTTPFATYYCQPNAAGWVHFDLSSAIGDRVELDTKNPDANQILHELPSAANFIFGKGEKGFQRFRIACGESYGTPPVVIAGTVTYFDVAVIDGVTPIRLGAGYNLYNDFGSLAAGLTFWLTDRPSVANVITIKAQNTDRGCMAFLNNRWATLGGGLINRIKYEIFNGATSLGTHQFGLDATTGTVVPTLSSYDRGKITYMGVLPWNLSSVDSGVPSGIRPTAVTWTHYTLEPIDTGGAQVGNKLRVENTPAICKHAPTMLAWANDAGGWELFRMDGRTTVTEAAQSKAYRKLTGSYNAAAFTFNPYDRGDKEFFINRTDNYTFRSGLLSQDEVKVLAGVAQSTNVMVFYAGEWMPVTVSKGGIAYGTHYSGLTEVTVQAVDARKTP